MKRSILLRFAAIFSAGFALLFSIGAGHSVILIEPTHGMTATQCQSSCPTATIQVRKNEHQLEDKELEPQPAEPYYLSFIKLNWLIIPLVSAAYLLKHLRWRPPDIFKLNVNYQF